MDVTTGVRYFGGYTKLRLYSIQPRYFNDLWQLRLDVGG